VLPCLERNVADPAREGRESDVFGGWRITERAIYRLLANPHYPALREVLRAIENVIGAGISLKELRAERDRGNFGSFLAEALVADHLLRRGLAVSRGRGTSGSKPDLEVTARGFTATVEVYSPRNWQARGDWVGTVIDKLKNADVPYEYTASVSMNAEVPMHSDELEKIIDATGAGVLRRLDEDIAVLTASTAGKTWIYDHDGAPMSTSVKLLGVADNDEAPVRMIASSPPGDWFQADMEFDDLLGKIVGKAGKAQATRGTGALRGLAVDASRSGVDDLMELGRLGIDQWLPKGGPRPTRPRLHRRLDPAPRSARTDTRYPNLPASSRTHESPSSSSESFSVPDTCCGVAPLRAESTLTHVSLNS
jgi:hypothetical protein